MTTFHIITIFPEAIESYFDSSILKRAQEKKLIKVNFYNPRKFVKGYKQLDDSPFGGGPGMVFKAEPLIKTIDSILKKKKKAKVVIMAPAGKQFTQIIAKNWAKKYDDIIFICGRYEGVDDRVRKIFKAEEVSIGPYVLTGGELPTAAIIDAISRHIPGVLGKSESLEDDRGVGIPVYTRPEIFEHKNKKYQVPKVLTSGNHKLIEEWRKKNKRK